MAKILDPKTGQFVETDPNPQTEADRLDFEITMRDLGEMPMLYPDDTTEDLAGRLTFYRTLGAQ